MHDRTSAKQRDSHKLLSSMGLGWDTKKNPYAEVAAGPRS